MMIIIFIITAKLMVITVLGYLKIRTYSTVEKFILPREEEETN